MAVGELTAVDGQAVGVGQTVRLYIPAGSAYGLSARSEWHERSGIGSTFHGQTPAPREFNLIAIPGTAAAGLSINAWHGAAQALLRPSGGLRTLTATLDGSPVSIEAAIENVQVQDGLSVATATAYAPSQFWRSTTTQTDTTSTTTNGGNAPASPKITFNPTSTVGRKRVPITEVTGRGLVNHPFRISVDLAGLSVTTGANILLFDRGRSVPFQAINTSGTTWAIYFLLSLLPSEAGFVDVVAGSDVSNTLLANTLDPAGQDWAHASWSNTNWVFLKAPTTLNGVYAPSLFETARAPHRPGAWHRIMYNPAVDGAWVETLTGGSESISLNGGAGITLITQIKTVTTNAITGMGITAGTGSVANSLHYRKAGEWSWREGVVVATGSVGSPKELTTTDADDAVQLAITSNTSTSTDVFTQFDADPIVVPLQSGEVPTIGTITSTTMNRGNGTLTNSTTGDTITLEDLYWDDDGANGLIIDTNAAAGERLRVYPSLSTSPLYTASTGRGWRFSNRAGWPLVPGANTWAWSGAGSPTITLAWQDTWAV